MPISGEKLQDRARDTALALPGVSHGRPFTEQLDVYKVAGKVFLIVTDDPDERIVTLKAEPETGGCWNANTHRSPLAYQPNLRYPALGGVVTPGWSALVATLPDRPITLAIDGPAALDWSAAVKLLNSALEARGLATSATDLRAHLAPWPRILERTGSTELADDPDFDRLAGGTLADLFDELPVPEHTAARACLLGALYAVAANGLPTLADNGYDGAGIGVLTPIKTPAGGQTLSTDNRTYNRRLRGLRALGERGFALLKGRWRILQHTTASPSKIGDITRAALVLTHFETRPPTGNSVRSLH